MSRDKLGRNDPCFCGSGQKYKKCHLGREREAPLPTRALLATMHEAWSSKVCLHPSAAPGVCSKIIRAHTVQRARTLQDLADSSKHVLTFYPFLPDEGGAPTLQRRGWHDASTFTGFCSLHDSVFAPVEAPHLTLNDETAFLLCYRALCHELYQKTAASRARVPLRRLVDRGQPVDVQVALQRQHAASAAGNEKALDDLRALKALADGELLGAGYSAWRFQIVTFKGSLSIAATGTPTPNRDLNGNVLQVLHDPAAAIEHLYVSVISYGSGAAAVFGWRSTHAAPARFVASLMARGGALLPSYLAQFLFSHIENIYFSPSWWSGLSTRHQSHVRALAANGNPYYQPPLYLPEPLVPWQVDSIISLGAPRV